MRRQRTSPLTVILLAVSIGLTAWAASRLYTRMHVTAATFPTAESARLLYLFQAADCADYREMEAIGRSIAAGTGTPLVGILLDEPAQLARAGLVVEDLDLGFPVENGDGARYEHAMLRMGITSTPALVLVDERGVVRLAALSTKDRAVLAALQLSFEAYIPTLLAKP